MDVEQQVREIGKGTPDPGRFEDWLAKQANRDDETGKVARFVGEDIERGCWPSSYKAPDCGDRWGQLGRNQKKFEEHLIGLHAAEPGSIETFGRVYKEYKEARGRYFSWLFSGAETRAVEF